MFFSRKCVQKLFMSLAEKVENHNVQHKILINIPVFSEKFPNFDNRTIPKLAKLKSLENSV